MRRDFFREKDLRLYRTSGSKVNLSGTARAELPAASMCQLEKREQTPCLQTGKKEGKWIIS